MSRKKGRNQHPAHAMRDRRGFVSEAELEPGEMSRSSTVQEGFYVHSFSCGSCGVLFYVCANCPDRHRVGNVWCPECGQHQGDFQHYWLGAYDETGNELSFGEETLAVSEFVGRKPRTTLLPN